MLVGGGHAHVQVLRRFLMEPPERLRVTVVVDTPIAVYSGMVPGCVAGQYEPAELEIDVLPLARRAGAEVVLSAMIAIDPEERSVAVAGRPPIRYDLASLDIGSTVIGLDLPGVGKRAIPTRPIGRFVERIDEISAAAARHDGVFRVTVVGGGAGGVELAFTLRRRLLDEGREVEVTLLHAGPSLLEGFPASLGRRAAREAAACGIQVSTGVRVSAAVDGAVELEGGGRVESDALVWVAGATSHEVLASSGLPVDGRGFVRTRSTLQVEGFDTLFAVGDCATLIEAPRTPKAGVYAVRQGPYLTDNLLAFVADEPLRSYRPQRDFLTLLNLGDGTALGAKWGLSFGGRWVMRLKDRIDRRFMERFQVLDAEGEETEHFATEGGGMGEGDDGMLCGGCAAKLGQQALSRVLERLDLPADEPPIVLGMEAAEDVVAWETGGGSVTVSNLDGFRPFSDDAYLVGRVAAANAISDLLAKGVEPRYAQAFVAVAESARSLDREEYLYQLLCGAQATFEDLGVRLLGGHTTTAPVPLVGFQVEGTTRRPLLEKRAARPGDLLVLTKPLGTGVVLWADMRGLATGRWLAAAHASMVATNRAASRAAREAALEAATDVTGFGLAGHLADLLRASSASARIDLEALPALPGALELLAAGRRSTFHEGNRRGIGVLEIAPEAAERWPAHLELLFDPQTSGGLLLVVPPERLQLLLEKLEAAGEAATVAAVVGEVEAAEGRPRIRVVES